MATSLLDIMEDFKSEVSLYQTPITYTDALYQKIIIRATKQLYIDVGWTPLWDSHYSIIDDVPTLDINLSILEKEYIIVLAQLIFVDQIKGDVAKLVSYSTDALSVTHGDKPYRNLAEDKANLTNRLKELFYKFGKDITSMTTITSLEVPNIDVTYE